MIAISTRDFDILIDPETGALVRRLLWNHPVKGPVDLLHGPGDGPNEWPHKTLWFGLWPMVPFANRAFGARLRLADGTAELPANGADGTAAIHGFGWQDGWRVIAHASDAVTLAHEHEPGIDPYRYRATMTVQAQPDAVMIELSVVNRADRAIPFGLGLHPWFPRDAETTLAFKASRAMLLDDVFYPTGAGPLPDQVDQTGARPLPADRVIALNPIDWDGEATLRIPSLATAIAVDASDNWRCPVIWAPQGARFVCFEPQSHAVGAPSEAHVGEVTPLALLAPGESLSGWMTLRPRPL